jgi:phage tail-like protein
MAELGSLYHSLDPYKNYRFRLKWDGRYVAGITRVTALRRTTEVVKHSEGGNVIQSRKSPGRTEFDAITLERGITQDREFEEWANRVAPYTLTSESPVEFRKDVTIELYDDTGRLVVAYRLFRCWVSEYQALPDLDANGSAVAIEQIKLENEGWERDVSVAPSVESASQSAS